MPAKKRTPNTSTRRRSVALPPISETSIVRVPLKQFRTTLQTVTGKTGEIDASLTGTITLTNDQKSIGKTKTGEEQAFTSVSATMMAHPELFTSLAPLDYGKDPNKFEPEMLADLMERRSELSSLEGRLSSLLARVSGTRRVVTQQIKNLSSSGYKIAGPHAELNNEIRTSLAGAIEFYGAIGRKSAATRAKNEAAKQPTK